jgi:hypothetical protein
MKRLAAMKQNPKGDWTIADVEALCRSFGIECRAPSNGSHYVISHPVDSGMLTVPARRPIKAIYIMLVVELVECVIEKQR